jgi:transposase
LSAHLGVIDELTEEIEELDEEIEARAESLAETQLLMTAPGISYITALTLYAEIGDIGRF